MYGESLDMQVMEEAILFLSQADVLIVGGTSLVVYPAAGLLQYFRGSKLILINKEEIEESAVLAAEFEVGIVPAFVVFRDGKPVNYANGVLAKDVLIRMLEI